MRNVRLTRSPFFAALLLIAPAALYACGGDGSSSSTSGSGGSSSSTTTTDSSSSSTTTTTGGAGGAGGASASSSSGSSTGSSMVYGKIKVNVSYAGTQTGSLYVAAVSKFPPQGPPDSFTKIAMPTFPAVAELTTLPPASYYVVVYLDVGNNNPTMPGTEDPTTIYPPPGGSMLPVEVKGNDEPSVDITLKDKMM